MKITRIKIMNLRAIAELELDLTAGENSPLDLVVLAGSNGCGKTSVLEACLWALNQDALPDRVPPKPYDLIELDIEDQGQQYRIKRSPESHLIQSGNSQSMVFPKKGLPTGLKAKVLYFSSWRAPRLIGSVPLSMGKGKRPTARPPDALWRLKQHLINLTGASAIGGFRQVQAVTAPELIERMMELWREFYPGAKSRFEVRVAAGQRANLTIAYYAGPLENEAEEDLTFDLFLFDKDHPQGVAIDDLSSGELAVLSMIGAFLLERTPYDLVLIDEPELHLHPAWHRTMINVLRKALPKSQLICATHSEHILDAVYSHERFTLLNKADPRLRLVPEEMATRA